MFTRNASVVCGLLALVFASACGGGSGSGSGRAGDQDAASGGQEFYEKTCAQTACDECRDDKSNACSECTSICTRSSSGDCLAACADICRGSCAACTRETECKTWRVTLAMPKLDVGVYDACLALERACPSGLEHPERVCHYEARVMRPEVSQAMSCAARSSCHPCTEGAPGTLGTELCERELACTGGCSYLVRDDEEGFLRPELVQGLRSCIAEPTCAEFTACSEAYRNLGRLNYAEGVGDVFAIDKAPERHVDDGKWYEDCYGSSSCGVRFACLQSCDDCEAACGIPCKTDADCVGQFVGTAQASHCLNLDPAHGGHCVEL